jgi:Zn finger protein HypA/HybF involved in hydrogenase expression/predicted transcriptional regulator
MRTREEYEKVMELKKQKLSSWDIYKKTNIPYSTIRGWISGDIVFNAKCGSQSELRRSFTKEAFVEAVKICHSKAQVLIKLSLAPFGANYKMFNKLVKELNLDTSHFTGQGYLKGKKHNFSKKIDLKDILVNGSNYSSYKLKLRLIKEKNFEDKCSICGIRDWQNKKLSLHLDHINGTNNDNRIENLRILCPNCHSQTDTYCGKSKAKKQKT